VFIGILNRDELFISYCQVPFHGRTGRKILEGRTKICPTLMKLPDIIMGLLKDE
jgi:hypothetical protein